MSSDKTLKAKHIALPGTQIKPAMSFKKSSTSKPKKQAGKLQPQIFVLTKNGVQKFNLDPLQVSITFGKSKSADILVEDETISDIQATMVRVSKDCLFMDRSEKGNTFIDGIQQRQVITPMATRIIMKLGESWVIYSGFDSKNYSDTDSVVLKKELLAKVDLNESLPKAALRVSGKLGLWVSNQRPCLIGKHTLCDYKITGKNIQDFHCLISWRKDGIFIKDLTYGKPGIILNKEASNDLEEITDKITLIIEKSIISIEIEGNVKERCEQLFHQENIPRLALSPLGKKSAGLPYELPVTNESIPAGRDATNGFIVDDAGVSRIHAHLIPGLKSFTLIDNKSKNGTRVNHKKITEATVHPGDIISFSNSVFLVHYSGT